MKLFAHPFDLAVEDSPDGCQMELIELHDRWKPTEDIQNIVWWTFTNTMFVESFPISSVMQEI